MNTLARSRWLHAGFLLTLVFAAYANVYPNGYHMDDTYRIEKNPHVRYVHPVSRHFADPSTMATLPRITQYRPLLPLSLSINHWLGGHSVEAYHVGNVLLQALTVLMLYGLLSTLLAHFGGALAPNARVVALSAAALFAVHPVSGIPVNYLCARDLTLMASALLGACWLWVAHRTSPSTDSPRRRNARLFGAALLLLVALMAKKNAVVAPALLVAFELTCGGRTLRDRRVWGAALATAGLLGAYLAFVRYGVGFSDMAQIVDSRTSRSSYVLTQLRVHVTHYLANLCWPIPVRQVPSVTLVDTLSDPGALAGLVVIVASLAAAWRCRQNAPLVSLGLLAWWVFLLPTSSIIPTHAPAVHYRPYLSTGFAGLLIAISLWRWLPPRFAASGAILLVGALSLSTWQANKTWRSNETLFAHSIAHGGSAHAHLDYAVGVMTHDLPLAKEHLERALEMTPGYIVAHINLGLVMIAQGDPQAGLKQLEYAVRLDPSRAQSKRWLAEGRRRALRDVDAPYTASVQAQTAGRYEESLKQLRVIETFAPRYRRIGFNIGFALQMLDRREEAITAYRAWLQSHPEDMQTAFNLGWALMKANRCDEAIPAFERAVALKPDYEEARQLIGACKAKSPGAAP